MNTLSLAWRNLLRNRRRSLTTLLAMMIGVVAILLFGGYSGNINLGLQTGFVRQSGHLQIQKQDYFLYGSGNPAAYGIADYQKIIDIVKADPVLSPMLTVVTPTLNLGGIAGNFAAGVSRTVLGSGVIVAEQNQLRRWNDYQFPGAAKTLALTGSRDNAAVVGTGVARVLQLCGPLKVSNCPQAATPKPAEDQPKVPDDISALAGAESTAASTSAINAHPQIELLAANSHGAPNVATLAVVKAENQGIKEFDDLAVTLHLKQAQQLVYGGDAPRVTAIVLQLKHSSQIAAAEQRFNELMKTSLKGMALEIHDYATLNPSYGQITGMFAAIFSFITLLIGAIVLFTVGNTMSMAVVERTTEIGTLRAIGLRRGGIRRLFVCEGILLGLLGAVLGVSIALALAYLINHSGLSWLPPNNTEPVPLTVRVWGEIPMIVSTGIGLLIVAAISAWWPARRAAQLNIVDALRHV